MSKIPSKQASESRKVNSELFTLTYGSLVVQLIKDHESDEDVNCQLDKIGYNIGIRLIDDFLSKNLNISKCNDFRETADVIAKQAFKLYLGIIPTITNWNSAADEFSLIFYSNPLTEFVELDADSHHGLRYSQVLCGVLRGALGMVHMEISSWFVQDQLRGDNTNEIRVKFIRKLEETLSISDD